MLRDGTICPINSPYASPVVLTRKNNDLPPDSPEAYRFAIDYRKLNGITKYPRYPLPLLPAITTINSEVYCHQLDKLNDALQQKRSELINRKGVVFHQDNARHHTSLVTRQKLL
ncbi:histone-lysine N-methyltransferase SETMAR [Trichonephila clavipes]|nr:histone-lysine N-methyltransferase SETMAR [Trichonephila clavipes]